jgi:hypothetical protein
MRDAISATARRDPLWERAATSFLCALHVASNPFAFHLISHPTSSHTRIQAHALTHVYCCAIWGDRTLDRMWSMHDWRWNSKRLVSNNQSLISTESFS